jgi:hypothetical protein
LPKIFWLYMALTMLAYSAVTHKMKTWFVRRYGTD